MARNTNLLNRINKAIEKRANRLGTGLSFVVILDDEPPEIIRTRGYKPNDSDPIQPIKTQTTED